MDLLPGYFFFLSLCDFVNVDAVFSAVWAVHVPTLPVLASLIVALDVYLRTTSYGIE